MRCLCGISWLNENSEFRIHHNSEFRIQFFSCIAMKRKRKAPPPPAGGCRQQAAATLAEADADAAKKMQSETAQFLVP